MMPFDYSKLSGLIEEKYHSRAVFANKIGISERSLSLKMTGKIQWKQNEILKACTALEIADNDIPLYFFTIKVQSD